MEATGPFGAPDTLFQSLENWLDREPDQLSLWLPTGIGFGVAIWQMFGPSAWLGLALSRVSLALFGMLPQSGSRLRNIVHMAAISTLVGFSLIAFRSTTVAQPVLGKIWIRDFYGRIETAVKISARDVFRLRLATSGGSELPRYVRGNLSPEQYQNTFWPRAILRLCARLMPPAGPILRGGYDFARRAWFQQIGATGTALREVRLHQAADGEPLFATKRAELTEYILVSMPKGVGSVGAALVTGDQGHISGMMPMVTAPRPSILVTGNGKNMTLVSPDGEVALLREKANDFIRGMIFEKAGSSATAMPIEDWPGVKCTPDNCVIALKGRDRSETLLATGTFNPIPAIYLKDQHAVRTNENNRHSPRVQAAIKARVTVSSNQ